MTQNLLEYILNCKILYLNYKNKNIIDLKYDYKTLFNYNNILSIKFFG